MLEKNWKKFSWRGRLGIGEIAQWFRTVTAFPEDLSFVPSTHVRWLTATVTQATRNPRPSASLPRNMGVSPMHTNKIKITPVLKRRNSWLSALVFLTLLSVHMVIRRHKAQSNWERDPSTQQPVGRATGLEHRIIPDVLNCPVIRDSAHFAPPLCSYFGRLRSAPAERVLTPEPHL